MEAYLLVLCKRTHFKLPLELSMNRVYELRYISSAYLSTSSINNTDSLTIGLICHQGGPHKSNADLKLG